MYTYSLNFEAPSMNSPWSVNPPVVFLINLIAWPSSSPGHFAQRRGREEDEVQKLSLWSLELPSCKLTVCY